MRKIAGDSAGATAIEYGLIAGLIALGILGSLVTTRSSLNGVFNAASSNIAASTTPSTGKVAYDFASQTVTSRSTYTGSTYGLGPGQTETVMHTAYGYITYANPSSGGGTQMSLYDTRINNRETVYYQDAFGG